MDAADIALVIAPLFVLVAIGFGLRSISVIKPSWIKVLNACVYWISLPALIVHNLGSLEYSPASNQVLLTNFVAVLAVALLVFVLLLLTPLTPKHKAAVFTAALVGNTIYMGVPIYQAVLPGGHALATAVAALHLVAGMTLSMLAIEYWVVKSRDIGSYAKDLAQNPLIIAVAAGMLVSALRGDGQIPNAIAQPLAMLAATASPLALVALGAFMYGRFSTGKRGVTMLAIGLKLAIYPLVVFAVGSWMGLQPLHQDVATLAASMPVAVTAFILSEKYRLDNALMARIIVLGTAASVLTIPLVFALL